MLFFFSFSFFFFYFSTRSDQRSYRSC